MIRLFFASLLFITTSTHAAVSCLTVPGTEKESPQFSFRDDLQAKTGLYPIVLAIHPKHGSGYVTLRDGEMTFGQNGGVSGIKVDPKQMIRELDYVETYKGFTTQTEIFYKGKRLKAYGMYENGDVAFHDDGEHTARLSYNKAVKAVYAAAPKNLKVDDYVMFRSNGQNDARPGHVYRIEGLTAHLSYNHRAGEGGMFVRGGPSITSVPISRIDRILK